MNTLLKAGCIAIYLLAASGALLGLPSGLLSILQSLALILLGLHALEALIAFKHLERYRGPLIDSLALTLLFGLLHWMPLSRQGTNKA